MTELTVRKLVADDLDSLARIRQFAFLDTTDYDDPGHRGRLLQRMENMSGVFRDGALVAAGAMMPFTMYHEGRTIAVAGLASVVSSGAHRRQGHVRRMLAEMLADQSDRGVGWSLEYPFDTRYYARFGWQTIPTGLVVEVPTEQLDRSWPAFSGERLDRGSDDVIGRLQSVWAEWAPRYNFSMSRDGSARPDWELLVHGSPWASETRRARRFVFASDDAYLLLQMSKEERGGIATVVDRAWRSPSGRAETFGLLASLRGQVDAVRIQLPFDEPVLLDWTPWAVSHPHPLQARVVDVESALSPLVAGTDLSLTFRVVDDFCPWNDGVFRIGGGEVARVDRSAEEVVDVRTLALLLSGADVDQTLLDGPTSLRSLVERRPFMPLSDYF